MTTEGPAAVLAVADVSRETIAKLKVFADLIAKWNAAENLISPGDLHAVWTRHFADCAQLPGLLRELPTTARHWIDIGSGAGLPGVVIALVGPPGTHVDLIESNRRKCAFLRQAVRETGAPATVHEGRAEHLLAAWTTPADAVLARAVAQLDTLLELALPALQRGAVGLFPKGRGFRDEVARATLAFQFDLVQHPSRIDPAAAILEVRNVRRKDRQLADR